MSNKIKCIAWWVSFMVFMLVATCVTGLSLLKLFYQLPNISPFFASIMIVDTQHIMNFAFFTVLYVFCSYIVIRIEWWVLGKVADLVVKNNDWATSKTIFPE